jgi:DNA-binding NarL/FixJ family response regulator
VPSRVVVVDDHATFRQMAARLLTTVGYDVVGEADDAASALEAAARLRPDIVLLDVLLPDRSGVEVAGILRRQRPAPTIVLTSSRSKSDFGPTFEWPLGCEFLPKHQLTAAVLAAMLPPR